MSNTTPMDGHYQYGYPPQAGYAPQPGYAPQSPYGYAPMPVYANPPVADAPSAGFAVLGFFVPIVGLILWLVWKAETPLKARSCGKGALIGVIVSVVFSIIYVIAIVVVMSQY